MIYIQTPYSLDKDLGKAYNQAMSLLPHGLDFACFLDGDAMFTTPDYGHCLQAIVDAYPEVPLFTCMTNRVGTDYQCVDDTWHSDNMSDHRKWGAAMWDSYKDQCIDITDNTPLSGVLMLVRKKEWKRVGGFKEGIGCLGVDNSIHLRMRDHGYRVYMSAGIYVMHYYRGGIAKNKSHLR